MGLADPLDAALGRRNDVVEALAGQVGQLHPLRLDHSGSTGFQLGRLSGGAVVSPSSTAVIAC